MRKIIIEKGFFYGAGSPKVYNWEKDGFHIHGVGINMDAISIAKMKSKQLKINVEDKDYTLNPQAAAYFISHYNSVKNIRGTKIGVVSRTLLNEV